MEVYIDILFIINFFMDLLILYIVKLISSHRAGVKQLLVGSVAGATGMCMLLFIPAFLFHLMGYIFLSGVMIYLTFKPKKIGIFIKLFILTYVVAIGLGGGIYAVRYTRVGGHLYRYFYYGMQHFSISTLIVATIICYVFIRLFINWYGKDVLLKRHYHHIRIGFKGQIIDVHGLVDTGHSLVDPITGSPVLIVESTQLKDIYEKLVLDQNYLDDRTCIIPYSVIGGEDVMTGLRPDYIEIDSETGISKIEKVMIGVVNKKLSKQDKYHALIHPALIQ